MRLVLPILFLIHYFGVQPSTIDICDGMDYRFLNDSSRNIEYGGNEFYSDDIQRFVGNCL